MRFIDAKIAAALRLVLTQDMLQKAIGDQYGRMMNLRGSMSESYEQALSDLEGLEAIVDILDQLETEYDFA